MRGGIGDGIIVATWGILASSWRFDDYFSSVWIDVV